MADLNKVIGKIWPSSRSAHLIAAHRGMRCAAYLEMRSDQNAAAIDHDRLPGDKRVVHQIDECLGNIICLADTPDR